MAQHTQRVENAGNHPTVPIRNWSTLDSRCLAQAETC